MDSQEHPDTNDEFDVEVSDVRPQVGAASPPPARSPLQPRLTLRRRLVRFALVLSTGLLALMVVLTTIPAVRDEATGVAGRLFPSPTPTLVPGSDLFSLLPNPPGVVASLDGHTIWRHRRSSPIESD